ncbi:MAG: site-specific integrase, partial [Bdellovibrionales bacterium]|nr:site-specific integrase [Bdellovibrionales bacterium]
QGRLAQHRFYPMWSVALMSGMRSGEMYALRWSNVDFESGFISVRRQWTNKDGLCPPKWGSSRMVPISEAFKLWLREYRLQTRGFRKTLWDSDEKQNVTYDDYVLPETDEWKNGMQASALRDFCRVIQIPPVRFHDLRATFITNMLTQGVPLVQVMAIVGHRKMGTTDKYLRKAGIGLKGATEALGYTAPEEPKSADVLKFVPQNGG